MIGETDKISAHLSIHSGQINTFTSVDTFYGLLHCFFLHLFIRNKQTHNNTQITSLKTNTHLMFTYKIYRKIFEVSTLNSAQCVCLSSVTQIYLLHQAVRCKHISFVFCAISTPWACFIRVTTYRLQRVASPSSMNNNSSKGGLYLQM